MKIITAFIFSLLIISTIQSQDRSALRTFSLNIMPYYESWSIESDSGFSEFTNIISAAYFAGRNTRFSLSTRYASVGGDVAGLNGLSDTQVLFSQKIPDYNIVFDAGLNIPSGKTKLKQDEFTTSRLISQNLFNLRTSGFGQGLNIHAGFSWTKPLSDKVVAGAGLSYQIKNEYQPLDSPAVKYSPSNELSLTAGFDIKLNETSTLTGDVTGIIYGSDKADGEEIFSSGSRIITSLLYRQYFGYNILSLHMMYRVIGLDELNDLSGLTETEKINPNQFYSGVFFRHRISSGFNLTYGLTGIFYEETSLHFSGYSMFGLSLSPEFRLSDQLQILIFLRYSFGNADNKPGLNSFEIGTGLRLSM
jgi:hypothetical protein